MLADHAAAIKILGFGFVAGSLFAVLIMLIFDWLKSKRKQD